MATEEVKGFRELQTKLQGLEAALTGPEIARIRLAAAKVIRQRAQQEAPVGEFEPHANKKDVKWQPGQLKKAIIAFLGRSRGTADPRTAWARVNIFRGRDRAPHAHLVEFGTRERYGRRGDQKFKVAGHWVRKRRVAGMPANPFFKRAVKIAGPAALEAAAAKQKQIIDRAMSQ